MTYMYFRSLNETLDRTRNKYKSKLKQLEQQILQPMMKRQFGKSFELDAGAAVNGTMDSQIGGTSSVYSTETDQTSD
jgi:hypothetical protein